MSHDSGGPDLPQNQSVLPADTSSETNAIPANPFKEPSNIINLVGIIVGIGFVLLVPKPYAAIVGMAIIFVCAALIIWNLRWVEDYAGRRILSLALLAVACSGFGYATWPVEQRPTPELRGLLIPASEPLPQNWCSGITSGPRRVMNVRLGVLGLVTASAHSAISVGGEEIFGITKVAGGLKVSARVIDTANQVVAQISDNELYVNPSDRFKLLRPDWHSLIIMDEKGKKRVLDVYFANPNYVRVYGRFFVPGGAYPALILEEGMTIIGSNIIAGRLQCIGIEADGQQQSINLGGVDLVAE